MPPTPTAPPSGEPGPGTTDATVRARLDDVSVVLDGAHVLTGVDWEVRAGERWVVVGPNGSGKTTLLRLLSAWLAPSSGRAEVLGEVLGRTDVRALRPRIGVTSQAVSDLLRPTATPHEVVLAAPEGALEAWWHRYDDDARAEAAERLARLGIDEATAHRPMRTLSAGERQRVLLARASCGDPGLLCLDEPTAGLDVGGREDLLVRLDDLAGATSAPIVLVTHHLEEIPPSFDRVLLLRDGRVAGAGPAGELLRSDVLSELYGLALDVRHHRGRWSATAQAT